LKDGLFVVILEMYFNSAVFRFTTRALYWDRGRLARNERRKVRWSRKVLNFSGSFALRAHCGRAARGPSEELVDKAKVTKEGLLGFK